MDDKSAYRLLHPPIFVCGVQRSGTTLLVQMLSRHPKVQFLPQETHFYPLFWNPGDDLRRFGNPDQLSELVEERLPEVNYGWSLTPEFLNEWKLSLKSLKSSPANTGSLLRNCMCFWQEQQGEKIQTGEKTPAHIYYALQILKEFPGCRLVLMCRDPRAAALSEWVKLKDNKRTDRKFNAFNFIVRWSTAVALSRRLVANNSALLIKYEDLITDPSLTLQKVTSFLDIDITDDMLEVGVTNSSFSDKNQEGMGFNTQNLKRWENELAPDVISQIESHLKSQMLDLGYSMSDTIAVKPPKAHFLKQRAKLALAHKVCSFSPAWFHHHNRNKKYRF